MIEMEIETLFSHALQTMGGRRFDSVREVAFNADGHPQFESVSSAVENRARKITSYQ